VSAELASNRRRESTDWVEFIAKREKHLSRHYAASGKSAQPIDNCEATPENLFGFEWLFDFFLLRRVQNARLPSRPALIDSGIRFGRSTGRDAHVSGDRLPVPSDNYERDDKS